MGDLGVDLRVEFGSFGLVISDCFFWAEHDGCLLREAAEIKVVTALDKLIGGEPLGFGVAVSVFDLSAIHPPLSGVGQVFPQHWSGLGERFVVFGEVYSVVPGFFGCAGVIEEQQVGSNGGVGREHRARQADDGVEVELLEEPFLKCDFCAVVAEEEPVGQYDPGSAVSFEPVGDERDEEVCGFRGTEGLREVRFDRFLLGAAVGRVHGDDVELLALFEVAHVAFE